MLGDPRPVESRLQLIVANRGVCPRCHVLPRTAHQKTCPWPHELAVAHRDLCLIETAQNRCDVELETTTVRAFEDFIRRGGTL